MFRSSITLTCYPAPNEYLNPLPPTFSSSFLFFPCLSRPSLGDRFPSIITHAPTSPSLPNVLFFYVSYVSPNHCPDYTSTTSGRPYQRDHPFLLVLTSVTCGCTRAPGARLNFLIWFSGCKGSMHAAIAQRDKKVLGAERQCPGASKSCGYPR